MELYVIFPYRIFTAVIVHTSVAIVVADVFG